jgi:hypothetical protein
LLQKRSRRQNVVGIIGGIREELLVNHREEVRALEAPAHRILIGSDRRRIRVVDEDCVNPRAVSGIVAKLGEGMAEAGHIHHARLAAKW